MPPQTYSVSFKLWDEDHHFVAQSDFGLPYTGTGWYDSLLSAGNLTTGRYLLTATVYDWHTGQRLQGSESDQVGDVLTVMDVDCHARC